jgi:putative ABC transport system ATP-binding protein
MPAEREDGKQMPAKSKSRASQDQKLLRRSDRSTGVTIAVKDLIKVYKVDRVEVQALRGLSMAIDKGEIVCVMGPSGSGKTTLLNIIGGLDTPTAGMVKIGDSNIGEYKDSDLVMYRRKMVGHIFQNLNLIPTLTAAENVELPMIAAGAPKSKRNERTKSLLAAVGLSDRAHHKPGELSGGEQQRVAIAAALANDPEIILADEPTGELDSTTARKVVELLVKVSRNFDKTTILVTHDPNVARPCDRIMRIEDGVIKASYKPVELDEGATPTTSYAEKLRDRIDKLDSQITELEDRFRKGEMNGEEFAEQRIALKQTRKGLEDELHRLGE